MPPSQEEIDKDMEKVPDLMSAKEADMSRIREEAFTAGLDRGKAENQFDYEKSKKVQEILEKIKKHQDIKNVLGEIPEELLHNEDFLIDVAKENSDILKHIDPKFLADKKFMQRVVKADGWAFKYCHPDLKKDEEIVLTAMETSSGVWAEISPEFKKDKNFALKVLKRRAESVIYDHEFQKEFLDDKEFVLKAIEVAGTVITEVISGRLKDDEEIMGLSSVYDVLKFSSKRLQDNEKFALFTLKNIYNRYQKEYNGNNRYPSKIPNEFFSYLSERLKNDPEFIKKTENIIGREINPDWFQERN